jgi:electron transfer flavoprotein beta subunit
MVPGLVAEMLKLPFVSFATHMEMSGEKQATLKREIDGGVEVVETSLPVVVSCQKGIAEWRIPNMRGIMAARKKPLSVVAGVGDEPTMQTKHFSYPPPKGDTTFIDPEQPEALIDQLMEKGVI